MASSSDSSDFSILLGESVIECVLCDEKFQNNNEYSKHFLHEEVEKFDIYRLECDFCDFLKFNTIQEKIEHVMRDHGHVKALTCHCCSKLFWTEEAFQHHVGEVNREKNNSAYQIFIAIDN